MDPYRQVDLSVEDRLDLLERVREIVPRSDHLAHAGLARRMAVILVRLEGREAEAAALSDDALAYAEPLTAGQGVTGALELANARLARADVLLNAGRPKEAFEGLADLALEYERLEHPHGVANARWIYAETVMALDRIVDASVASAEAVRLFDANGARV